MKTFIQRFSVLLLLFCMMGLKSQTPNFAWAKNATGTASDEIFDMATDKSGNIYVVGYYTSAKLTVGTFTLNNADGSGSSTDAFLIKYNSAGTPLWTKTIGGSGTEKAYGVTVDKYGSVYMTGFYQTSTLTIGASTFSNSGLSDIFIVKYDSLGNQLWARKEGGNGNDVGKSLTADTLGNLYLGANFGGTLAIGTNTYSAILTHLLLAKYNSASGALIWSKTTASNGSDQTFHIASDKSGNVFATGYYSSGNCVIGTTTLTNVSSNDMYTLKIDPSGNYLWAKSVTGNYSKEGLRVAPDKNGDVIVAAHFSGTVVTAGTQTITNAGGTIQDDILILKYDANGILQWNKVFGGNSYEYPYGMTLDTASNIYITGYTQSASVKFGTFTLTTISGNLYMAKLDPSGNAIWGKSVAGQPSWGDYGYACASDRNSNIYFGGSYRSHPISLTPFNLNNTDASHNTYDLFITKLGTVTGVEELSQTFNANVYPNPVQDKLIVRLKDANETCLIQLHDMSGKSVDVNPIVFENADGVKSYEIGMQMIPSGVYVLKLDNGKKSERFKVIVNH